MGLRYSNSLGLIGWLVHHWLVGSTFLIIEYLYDYCYYLFFRLLPQNFYLSEPTLTILLFI